MCVFSRLMIPRLQFLKPFPCSPYWLLQPRTPGLKAGRRKRECHRNSSPLHQSFLEPPPSLQRTSARVSLALSGHVMSCGREGCWESGGPGRHLPPRDPPPGLGALPPGAKPGRRGHRRRREPSGRPAARCWPWRAGTGRARGKTGMIRVKAPEEAVLGSKG